MASNKVIILALLLIAIVGLASATEPATTAAAPAGGDDDSIGTSDDGVTAEAPGVVSGEVVPGPLGSGSDTDGSSSPAESPKAGASALEFSAIAGVAAVAGYFF
ncbi:classical arabinogalactan protein 11-like [Mercurialis annua]|uniref:classical arabinogalactan protein 11-like n=1 Tax=Mercurialis annua TaxID=3986 RepID=UPI00215EA9A9|nr:classical arabinogalactan protein 11-like [Mercurialis annua]